MRKEGSGQKDSISIWRYNSISSVAEGSTADLLEYYLESECVVFAEGGAEFCVAVLSFCEGCFRCELHCDDVSGP